MTFFKLDENQRGAAKNFASPTARSTGTGNKARPGTRAAVQVNEGDFERY